MSPPIALVVVFRVCVGVVLHKSFEVAQAKAGPAFSDAGLSLAFTVAFSILNKETQRRLA
jgi:hypothetical protein